MRHGLFVSWLVGSATTIAIGAVTWTPLFFAGYLFIDRGALSPDWSGRHSRP